MFLGLLPVSSCLISSPSFSPWGKPDRALCLWDIQRTRLIFSNYPCQHAAPLFQAAGALFLWQQISTLLLWCFLLQAQLPCMCPASFPFSSWTPKAPRLLWVLSLRQPCVLYAVSLSCSLALLFLLPFQILIFLDRIEIPPPLWCFPYYSSDNPPHPVPQLFPLMNQHVALSIIASCIWFSGFSLQYLMLFESRAYVYVFLIYSVFHSA